MQTSRGLLRCGLAVSFGVILILLVLCYTTIFHTGFQFTKYPKGIDDAAVRAEFLRSACRLSPRRLQKNRKKQASSVFYHSVRANFALCKVPKAGSSLWTILYLYLDKKRSAENLLSIPRSQLHNLAKKYWTSYDNIRNSSQRNIIMTRDPYSRLYSAYIDKIYLMGAMDEVAKIAKGSASATNESSCYFDSSFQQFLNYVLKTFQSKRPLNRHWTPVYMLCNPCDIPYHYVAKQETLASDVAYITEQLPIPDNRRHFLDTLIRGEGTNKTISGALFTLMTIQESKHCPDNSVYVRKLWKSLQIQGYIRRNVTIDPQLRLNSSFLKKTDVIQTILDTISVNHMSSKERRAQRRQYLVDAYSDISAKTIRRIQNMFHMDFIFFNYDTTPPI